MSLSYAFLIYLLIWFVMLFTVLPLGVKPHGEEGKGYDSGAPEKPDIYKKLIINSVLSLIILIIIYVLIDTGVIRWEDWFDGGL